MSGRHWLKVARRPTAAVDMEAALHAILSAAPNLLDAQAPDVPRHLSSKSMLQLHQAALRKWPLPGGARISSAFV